MFTKSRTPPEIKGVTWTEFPQLSQPAQDSLTSLKGRSGDLLNNEQLSTDARRYIKMVRDDAQFNSFLGYCKCAISLNLIVIRQEIDR